MRADTVIIKLIKWRWYIAALFVLALITLEFVEHDSWGANIFYDLEFIIFFTTVLVATILFELLARSNRKLNATLRILDTKHRLNLELSQEEDWDTLTARLAEFPHAIAGAVESVLIFCDPITGSSEHAARWGARDSAAAGLANWKCVTCLDPKGGSRLHPFKSDDNPTLRPAADVEATYCLPVSPNNKLVAFLRFRLAHNQRLTSEQVVILDNVVDEMAISLKTSRERKNQADMRIAEANLVQRKDIWRYLHDNLGQNLAYLRLKLDQFSRAAPLPPLPEIRTDLQHMRDVSDESYMMVRNWLESRHPKTQSPLAELLVEHAREISRRGAFEIEVSSEGEAVQLSPPAQEKLYYIFREILNNVANHASATRVEVALTWSASDLRLTISDNGVGFDPRGIDSSRHFGFGIMNERVAELNGRLEQVSSLKGGTLVSIWVPIQRSGSFP